MSSDPLLLPLPMFPLGTVLFPHALLPLHVFEPRYRALVQDLVRGKGEFGVVLIERGFEVGGGDTRFSVGTVARLVEAVPFPDGRWALATIGDRRIRVATWLPDDPYPVALVEDLHEPPLPDSCGAQLRHAERWVRRALAMTAELGEDAAPATLALDPVPEKAAYQLAAVAPLTVLDRQRLLEQESPQERLDLLAEMAEAACTVLAHRLGGG